MTIVYAQNVGPQQFNVVYKALYIDGMLGNLSVKPVADNGKALSLETHSNSLQKVAKEIWLVF